MSLTDLACAHRVSDADLAAAASSYDVAQAIERLWGTVEAADEAYEADAYSFYEALAFELEIEL